MLKDRVLVVEDERQWRETISTYLELQGCEVVCALTCAEADHLWRRIRPDVAVLDYRLPDGNALQLLPRLKASDSSIPIIILTGHGSIDLAVEAVKLGASQFLTKPIELAALFVMIQSSVENRRNRQKQLVEKNRQRRERIDPFLGRSAAIRKVEELANKVAGADSPVLIQGETGTGKGVLTRWIHAHGQRAAEPFLDLNCGGLSHDLLETELFGHEKGAFTGAFQNKVGLLEIAHKGTVFLDEIGDVDLAIQGRLLKVLEEKQFRRLGDVRDRHVDIRLIAATHQDIVGMVREHQFRSDFYFRVSTIPLNIPALRDRLEDIPTLTQYFVDHLADDLSAGHIELSDGVVRALQSYSWPGNIRELRNVLERAILLREGQFLSERDLRFDIQIVPEPVARSSVRTLDQIERQYIEEVLLIEGGRVEATAAKLGIARSSLYHKIKRYGISRPGLISLVH